MHVDVWLKHPRLVRYSTDDRAVVGAAAALPGQLTRSASVVLVMEHRAAAAHPLMYETGIESRDQLGQVVHVDVQLKHPRLRRYSTDGRAVGHVPAAPPGHLARSAPVVLVVHLRTAAAHPLMYETGIESREQLGRWVHVDARLEHPRLLR